MSELPPSQESVFDKKAINEKIDTAVDNLYKLYGDNIPESIEERGESARDTAHDILLRSSVNSKKQFIEAVDFIRNGGNISDEAYDLIIDNIE